NTRFSRDWSSDVCSSDLETPASQLLEQYLAVDRIVVDDQYARPGHVAGHALIRGAGFMHGQRYGEPEDGTTADLAFDADLAAHQVYKAGGDGQAEAGPFMTAGGGSVDLGELLEHAL